MKKILITGGAGYIGSHTAKLFAKKNYIPVVFDNLVYGHRDFVKWGPFQQGDLLNQTDLARLFSEHEFAGVIHFAAYAYVGESVTDPLKYYNNNVIGTLNLLSACQKHQVDKFIFSSTCATYGTPSKVPIQESESQNPINPYGSSKLMIEQSLKDLAHIQKIRAVALRYFNAAGADADGELGEKHNPETHLIPLALKATDPSSNFQLTVFGNDYATPDGTCVRDYIHVEDLADAHLKAFEKIDSLPTTFSAFNLGTGQGHSVLEILDQVQKTTGHKPRYILGPRRAGDPAALVADPSLAARELNWTAQKSSLRNIIETAHRFASGLTP